MREITLFVLLCILGSWACYEDPTTCDERVFDRDSFVCVCDAEYCDVIGDVTVPTFGSYKRIVSSRDEHRFSIFENREEKNAKGNVAIRVNYNKEYQTIFGFGGSFTDSAGISISALPKGAQINLIKSYFSKSGIEYNVCRIPIAGTDFSTHPYSYDEIDNDIDLEYFALTKEDFLYKIPYIEMAKEFAEKDILFIASPWSPPAWMKENGKLNGRGGLLKHMWNPFTNYIIRFIEEYEKRNISLWGLTTTNEPTAGFHDWPWNACAWSPEDMRDWIKSSFGPALGEAKLNHLQVMVYDHGRDILPDYPAKILNDKLANKYVDGVAVHWYSDFTVSPKVLDELQDMFQDKFILYTEACEGFQSELKDKIQLGSWQRAENYSTSIIENLNHYSTGWVDWNLALNMNGGPNWAGNVVDAPIIVNEASKEFYKQPMFYAMGHFSKFIPRASKRLHTEIEGLDSSQMQAVAINDESNGTIIYVILNRSEEEQNIHIETKSKKYININMNAKSLETVLIKASS